MFSGVICFALSARAESFDWQHAGMPIAEHFDTMSVGYNPQNYTIKQDQKGFIYIGNGSGLLVFDGVNWQHLSHRNQRRFKDFELSQDGKIYAGTSDDLGFFSSDKKGNWIFNSLSENIQNLPKIVDVHEVLLVGSKVFYASQSHFFYYDPKDGLRWLKQPVYPIDLILEGNKILISTQDNKLYSFDLNLQTFNQVILETALKEFPVRGFVKLDDGRILAHSRANLFVRNHQKGLVRLTTEIDEWLRENEIIDIVQMPDKSLAIGTYNGGVAVISLTGKLFRFYNMNHGLKTNGVHSLFVDREQSLWIASASNGVSRVELNEAMGDFSSKEHHILSDVTAMFKQKIFVGAPDGLFELVSAESPLHQARFKRLDLVDPVRSFLTDDQELLIGSSKGISSLSIDEDNNYNYTKIHDGGMQQGSNVRQFVRLKNARNFAYAASQNGLIQLQKVNGQWRSNGLLGRFKEGVYSIHEDINGNLWVGTRTGGFYRLENLANWSDVKISKLDYPIAHSPSSAMVAQLGVFSLFNNDTTEVMMLSKDGESLVAATMAEWGEINGNNMMLSQNINRHAWLLTWDAGISADRVVLLEPLKDDFYRLNYSLLDHIRFQFVLGLHETDDGILWVNGKDRIFRYNTHINTFEMELKSPVLSKIELIGSGGGALFLNNRLDKQQADIQLQPQEDAVRLHYTSAEFRHRKNTEFRYRLSGVQAQWSLWQTATSLELTNLASGTYQFDLQYRVNPKTLSPVLTVFIERLPFWYQTWWGWGLIVIACLIFLLAFGGMIVRRRNQVFIRRARMLESQVSERTEIIQQQYDQLQKVDEAKNRFFTNISHEFRTPLSLAIGPLKEVLASGHISNEQDKAYLELALKNNQRMLELLGQVLDINKLVADKTPVEIVKINLSATLQYCIQRFELQAKKQGVGFKMVGFDHDLAIYFDADHFEKIVINLLSNAIKNSPFDGIIEVGLKGDNHQVVIWVKDQGAGIDAEDQPHIFDRFYQGKKSSHTIQPGTGIGLALVQELVKLHQAEIIVVNNVDKGACFTVTFPIKNHHYNSALISEYDRETSPRMINLSEANQLTRFSKTKQTQDFAKKLKKTVLVIDDNDELRLFIRAVLQSRYHIVEAENGFIGLKVAADEQPDVIVCDVMMPVMDGFEFARQLKSSFRTDHIPLILLTAKSTKRDTVFGLQQGADDYLSKPFDSAELAARIASQIAHKKRVAEKLLAQFRRESDLLSANTPATTEPSDKFSLNLNALIEDKLGDEAFGAEQMCQEMNTARSSLFRNIKKYYGCTPNQLLKTRRLELALRMLRSGQGTISEVAYGVGFQSLSTFSRAFQEQYQVPPTRFEEIV